MRPGSSKKLRPLGIAAAIVTAALLGVLAPAASAAPANDEFANREVIPSTLPATAEGSNVGATGEPYEFIAEAAFEAHNSVWWVWEAPSTQIVSIGTCGTEFQPVVGVFVGEELPGLMLHRAYPANEITGADCADAHSFRAVAGTKYDIVVQGEGSGGIPGSVPPGMVPSEGRIMLQISPTAPPANDDFADAAPITGIDWEAPDGSIHQYLAGAGGDSWGATTEPEEPIDGGPGAGATVWFSWTPSASGPAILSYCCSKEVGIEQRQEHGTIAVYTGSALGSLTPVASTTEPFYSGARFKAEAGREYLIAVGGRPLADGEPWMGNFFLTLTQSRVPRGPAAPAGDSPAPSAVPGANPGPTPEPEPNAAATKGGAALERKVRHRHRHHKARHAHRAKRQSAHR